MRYPFLLFFVSLFFISTVNSSLQTVNVPGDAPDEVVAASSSNRPMVTVIEPIGGKECVMLNARSVADVHPKTNEFIDLSHAYFVISAMNRVYQNKTGQDLGFHLIGSDTEVSLNPFWNGEFKGECLDEHLGELPEGTTVPKIVNLSMSASNPKVFRSANPSLFIVALGNRFVNHMDEETGARVYVAGTAAERYDHYAWKYLPGADLASFLYVGTYLENEDRIGLGEVDEWLETRMPRVYVLDRRSEKLSTSEATGMVSGFAASIVKASLEAAEDFTPEYLIDRILALCDTRNGLPVLDLDDHLDGQFHDKFDNKLDNRIMPDVIMKDDGHESSSGENDPNAVSRMPETPETPLDEFQDRVLEMLFSADLEEVEKAFQLALLHRQFFANNPDYSLLQGSSLFTMAFHSIPDIVFRSLHWPRYIKGLVRNEINANPTLEKFRAWAYLPSMPFETNDMNALLYGFLYHPLILSSSDALLNKSDIISYQFNNALAVKDLCLNQLFFDFIGNIKARVYMSILCLMDPLKLFTTDDSQDVSSTKLAKSPQDMTPVDRVYEEMSPLMLAIALGPKKDFVKKLSTLEGSGDYDLDELGETAFQEVGKYQNAITLVDDPNAGILLSDTNFKDRLRGFQSQAAHTCYIGYKAGDDEVLSVPYQLPYTENIVHSLLISNMVHWPIDEVQKASFIIMAPKIVTSYLLGETDDLMFDDATRNLTDYAQVVYDTAFLFIRQRLAHEAGGIEDITDQHVMDFVESNQFHDSLNKTLDDAGSSQSIE